MGVEIDTIPIAFGLAQLSALQGDRATAYRLYQENLALLSTLTIYQENIASGLEGLAALEAELGDPEHAVRLLGAAEALRESIGVPIYPLYRANYEQAIAVVRAKQGEQTFATLWGEGRKMTLEQALALATRLSATEKISALSPSPATQPSLPASVRLTRREQEVLQLVTAGLTNPEIAQRLVVSLPTVNTHVASIFKKLGVNSRAAATRYAIEHYLV